MARVSRVAVDTSVLVNFFNGGANDEEHWLEHSSWVMRAAQRGDHELVIPALAIAELAGDGTIRGNHIPKQVRHERVRQVRKWIRSSGFIVVDLDDLAAQRAADLAIEHQLKGADAAIVACAQRARASTLYSWDDKHIALRNTIDGLVVRAPQAVEEEQTTIDEGLTAASATKVGAVGPI